MLFSERDRAMNKNVQKMTPEDRNQLSQLYKQYYLKIYHYVYPYIKNEDATNDIVSDVFALACERFEQLKAHPNPIGWLHLTARNKVREFFRRLEREALFLESQADSCKHYGASCDNSAYFMKEWETTLHNSLTANEYRRFLRYFIWGYSIQEIAELEDISNNNVSVRLSRLRQKLKSYM